MKTLIECPNCKTKVDIDASTTQKREDGLDLIVKCLQCLEEFVVRRVKHVRQNLRAATVGYTEDGVKVKL